MDTLLFIKENLYESAKIANLSFGKVSSVIKDNDKNSVLTKIDLEIGKNIIKKIIKKFPRHNILNEETGVIDNKSQFTWIIDPIDGTSNFAAGLPFFGTMITLIENNQPIITGISLPFFKEIYLTKKNKGVYCNDKKINVTKEKNLFNTLISYGIDSHLEKPEKTTQEAKILKEIVNNIRNLRTTNSCYDACMVACGKLGGYLNQTMKIWDVVPLKLLIEEAQGKATDFFGITYDFENHLNRTKENFTICAASQTLHNKLQIIIHENK